MHGYETKDGTTAMDSPDMSKRTHFWLRLAALVVIAAAAWIPRGVMSSSTASMPSGEVQVIHASVTSR